MMLAAALFVETAVDVLGNTDAVAALDDVAEVVVTMVYSIYQVQIRHEATTLECLKGAISPNT